MTEGTIFWRLCRILTMGLRRLTLGRVPTLFDTAYYLKTYPDAARSRLDPFLYYVLTGAPCGHNPNGDFDTEFYRKQADTRLDPLRHYLRIGAAKGLDPHPYFSTFGYISRYPDVVAAKANPLQHYREHGRQERRITERSTRLPREIVPLSGITSDRHWIIPGHDTSISAITLIRCAPTASNSEIIAKICLSICLDVAAVDSVVDAFIRFPSGVQCSVCFEFARDPLRGGGIPRLLIEMDQCYLSAIAENGKRTVCYAQATVWDLRRNEVCIAANLPLGAIRIE